MKRLATILLLAVAGFAGAQVARADPIEDFYRGKTLRMLIGYGPGGGYDLYARLVAEFLPKHIPGQPNIVPQNMPGAGSFAAANYMAGAAPKDGTVLGMLAQTFALDSRTGLGTKLDIAKFHYLGRAVTNIDTGVALPKSGIRSFADVRLKQYTVGASGGGSTTVMFPSALAAYAGAKFKLVRGYKGTADIILAKNAAKSTSSAPMGCRACWSAIRAGSATARRRSFISVRSSRAGYWRTCRPCRSLRPTTKAVPCYAPWPAPARSAAPS